MATLGKLLKKYREIILYMVFGAGTTVINIAVYLLLTRTLGTEHYLWHNIVAWILSVLFAFVTNKLWVFESKDKSLQTWLKEGVPFFGARLFSLALDSGFLYVTVSLCHWQDGLMKLLSNVIVVIVNYVLSKLFIFRQAKS